MTLPADARIVIGGGGPAGCPAACQPTKLGITDMLLLEQGRLTCGTTPWHAAGLAGQMRHNPNMTAMSRCGIELYASLEAETGLATGCKACGSVNVARMSERMMVQRKQGALARLWPRVSGDLAARGRRSVAADGHRRPAGRTVDPRRRQGQSGAPDGLAGQGRRAARREDRARRGGHRHHR